MDKPGMIITGATGFLGKRLTARLCKDYRIFAIALRSPKEAGAPEGQGIHWFRVHIGHFDRLKAVFDHIRDQGGVDLLLHLAAYYDFTGENHAEYTHTNIMGTRNILELSSQLNLKRFIFTSSVAACPFPAPGESVTEATPPTALPPYSRSKGQCEEMIWGYKDRIASCILRLAAVYSDWCEYEPLDALLRTWCSNQWNARILGGKGQSAVPYLHVQDVISFYLRVIQKSDVLQSGEVLLASPDGSTSHVELYREATRNFFGAPRASIYVPKLLSRWGIMLRERLGHITRTMPFERSWMADYIDRRLDIDASRTRQRLDWAPDENLNILMRMPQMIRNMRSHPEEWERRSRQKAARDRFYTKSRELAV